MKKISFAVASAAVAFATPAFAQDASWTGFYVGAGFGVAASNSDVDAGVDAVGASDVFDYGDGTGEQVTASANARVLSDSGQDKIFGTIEAGFDFQSNNFVAGVFANYDFGSKSQKLSGTGSWEAGYVYGLLVPNAAVPTIDTKQLCTGNNGATCTYEAYPNYYDNGATNISGSVNVKDTWAVGARFGTLVNDSTLLYVSGGFTQAKVALAASATIFPSQIDIVELGDLTEAERTVSVSNSKWNNGYFLGAGAETKLVNNVSVKLDYRYADYGAASVGGTEDIDVADSGLAGTISATGGIEARDIHTHAVRLMVGYRF